MNSIIIKKLSLAICIILSGSLLAFSRYPQNLDFLSFISFIPMFIFFRDSREKWINLKLGKLIGRNIFYAFLYTIVLLPICVHWISLVTLPGFFGILILYTFYYSILFTIISTVIRKRPDYLPQIIVFGFISLEFLLSYGPFKFPWLNIGYSLAHSIYLIQALEYGGVYLLSLLILIVNYLLYKIVFDRRASDLLNWKKKLIILFIFLTVWTLSGYYRYKTLNMVEKDVKIGIVQVSIPQEEKWDPQYLESTFEKYENSSQNLVRQDSVDLVIWPEAATPVYLIAWPEYASRVINFTRKIDCNLFTGFPHFTEGIKYKGQPEPYLFYNSATQFKKDMTYDSLYFKKHLVPFGERIPFLEYFPILWKLQLGQANFESGTQHRYYQVKDASYSPLICFEILFPDYIREMLNKKTDFIVNITNDAWFKRSIGTYQHKMITVYRAIESRRAIYRSANTGYTVIISPRGDILKQIGLYEKGNISAKLITCTSKSFYHKIGFILPVLILFSFLYIIILTISIKNDKRNLL
jgi:apolipoprotein N-acyltransferase